MIRPKDRLLRRDIPKDAIRKALQDWSDRLSSWNEFFTAMVVLGLVIEYIPLVAKFLPTAAFIYMRARAEAFTDFGGFLVIAGVVGELVVGARSGRVETDLREENESIISHTRDRAAKAEQAAAEANLARVRLQQRLSSRDMSDEESNAIAARLAKFAGQRIIILVFPIANEPLFFANSIAATLTQAGWLVDMPPQQVVTLSPDGIMCSGFSMMSTRDKKSFDAGYALGFELRTLGDSGSVGPLVALGNPEDPRLQLVIHERGSPPKTSA